MPTYEYECTACGNRFEKFQQITARPVRKCPECGGRVKRLLGAGAAVITKSGRGATPAPPCARGESCDTCPMQGHQ